MRLSHTTLTLIALMNSSCTENNESNGIHITEIERRMYAEAANLSENGRLIDAIPILEQLAYGRPDCAIFLAVLANAYWEADRIQDAERWFRLAVLARPTWEASSLGLFHCLWEQGKKEEALDEIKRFMEISYSDEYVAIVKSINNNAETR